MNLLTTHSHTTGWRRLSLEEWCGFNGHPKLGSQIQGQLTTLFSVVVLTPQQDHGKTCKVKPQSFQKPYLHWKARHWQMAPVPMSAGQDSCLLGFTCSTLTASVRVLFVQSSEMRASDPAEWDIMKLPGCIQIYIGIEKGWSPSCLRSSVAATRGSAFETVQHKSDAKHQSLFISLTKRNSFHEWQRTKRTCQAAPSRVKNTKGRGPSREKEHWSKITIWLYLLTFWWECINPQIPTPL